MSGEHGVFSKHVPHRGLNGSSSINELCCAFPETKEWYPIQLDSLFFKEQFAMWFVLLGVAD